MKLSRRDKFLLIVVPLGVAIYIIFCFREYYKMKSLEFSGIVQNVQYDINGDVTVTVNDVVYKPVSNNWSFRGEIHRGDSLIKFKNTMVIKLLKEKSKEVIFFR